MGLAALEKKIRTIERMVSASVRECSRRKGEKTMYHSALELEKILAVRCPVHGFRDLGELVWIGRGLPLRPDDQKFCCCPPCAVRSFLVAKRGPLTNEEHEQEKTRWFQDYGALDQEHSRGEQSLLEKLVRFYEYEKLLKRRC